MRFIDSAYHGGYAKYNNFPESTFRGIENCLSWKHRTASRFREYARQSFEERLNKNDLLPLSKEGKHLLVETSYFNPPMGLSNILLCIKSKGYTPVLAHPERYDYMDESDYRQLKRLNVKFQLNLFSWVGLYGTGVRKKAGWLMKNGFYDLAGSDIHGLSVLEATLYKQKLPQTGHEQVFKADLW